jgi:hypothetical protein
MNDLSRVRQVITHPYTLLTLAALFWAGNVVLGRDVAGRIPPVTRRVYGWVITWRTRSKSFITILSSVQTGPSASISRPLGTKMFFNQMKSVLFDYGLATNLNRISIVGMSRADDLVSFVSPRLP